MARALKRPIKVEILLCLESNTVEEIADIYKVHPRTVTYWLRYYRIKDRRHSKRKLATVQVKEIRQAFEKWQKDFGVSRGCLFDVLMYKTYIEITI